MEEKAATEATESEIQEMKEASVLDVMKTPRLRKIFSIISILWMLISLVYDGHARNVANLPLDIFLTFSIASATELPADVFVVIMLDRWGRRWLAFGTMVLSGIFSLLSTAVPQGNVIAVAVLAILGRFCVNITFNIGMQYAAELIPTLVRAQGVAIVHIFGYVAALISPLIVFLGETYPFAPLMILGILSIGGGCLALLLPETLHCDLPQTLEDGKNFGSDQKFCYFPCIQRPAEAPTRLKEIAPAPSFIRRRPHVRASIRAETYRSSLIKHRREVIYIPYSD